MREGSLDAPVRHSIDWNDPDFYDMEKIEAELERVFDICHGCRRCFNLCDSFPKLFDLIDESETGELDSVDKKDYKQVVDACTLCDMCFMVSCPYVPPHEFDLDFPHLMLRFRAAELKQGKGDGWTRQLTRTDRNGRLASKAPGLANWASSRKNGMTRGLMQSIAGVHKDAELPRYHGTPFADAVKKAPPARNEDAPAKARKAVVYATCAVNYNDPAIGEAALGVLAKNGVQTEVLYPECCGMPQFEQGDVEDVAGRATRTAELFEPYIDEGHSVVALTPSCALMMKFEWPLLLPDDPTIKKLSEATFDITEYVVDIAKDEGLAEGLGALDGSVAVHIACHARAQNMGNKANEMLKLIPEADIKQLPRCSGHGGSWGIMKENFETGMKVGKPVFRDVLKSGKTYVASECPLATLQIVQGMEGLAQEGQQAPERGYHPIELFAKAYGLSA